MPGRLTWPSDRAVWCNRPFREHQRRLTTAHGDRDRARHHDRRRDGRPHQAAHPVRVVGTVEGRPDPRRRRQGLLLLDARGQALPGLQQPADVHEHRSRPSEGDRGDQAPGRDARLRQPLHGHRATSATRREAGRDHARRHRHVLLHQRRRGGQRERHQAGPIRHRPSQDPGSLSLLPRRHRRRHQPDRRPAPLGGRARHPRRRARHRPVPRHPARLGHRRRGARPPRGDDPARGPEHDRGLHPRDRDRHERHPRPARRLPAGRARDLRPIRDPPHRRRGDGRLRPHRQVVRGRPLGRRPRPHHHGQGPDQRLRPARRARHAAQVRGALQRAVSSTAASPTTRIRWPAPRRWPRSRCTRRRG